MEKCKCHFGISACTLKIIAIISMAWDHALKIVFNGISFPIEYWILGRIVFPIFCFLIGEGVTYTKNIWKYITSMAIFAVVSEVIYDLANYNNPLYLQDQNIFFELLLGLIVIYTYKCLKEKQRSEFIVFPLLFACALAEFFNFNYGMGGILCIFLFYFGRQYKGVKKYAIYLLAVLMTTSSITNFQIMALQLYSVLSLIPIALYNGEKGYRINKYVFYLFYPVHILILFLISKIL